MHQARQSGFEGLQVLIKPLAPPYLVQGGMELTAEEDQAILKLWMQSAFKNNEHPKMADKRRAAMLKYHYTSIKQFVDVMMDAHTTIQDSI
jgi:hypothetical protein